MIVGLFFYDLWIQVCLSAGCKLVCLYIFIRYEFVRW
jgi:hypothetical protein